MTHIKTLLIFLAVFIAGYLTSHFDNHLVKIQSTKSGNFILSKGHLYQVLEITHDNFYDDLQQEIKAKR
jgi:hypothetical protein